MFPATATPYAATALSELQVILFNARADALTSDAPTFPYAAEDDEKFINLLQLSKGAVYLEYSRVFSLNRLIHRACL